MARLASILAIACATPGPIRSARSHPRSAKHGIMVQILVWRILSPRIIFGPAWPGKRRRCMTRSPNPRPVKTGRYRYSKLRWRILVHALDTVGAVAAAAWRCVRPVRPIVSPRRILIVQLDHLGDSVLTSPLIAALKTAYPDATLDVLASPSNHEVFEA